MLSFVIPKLHLF